MTKHFNDALERYGIPDFKPEWARLKRGIEKESLRVSADGKISLAPHPDALGSALTNPYITTDFSEALLEFITPAYTDIDRCLTVLEQIHRFTLERLDGEILWASSMPCPLGSAAEIPIAQYGSSNIGRMKTLYRQGLSHRYGSLMQIIAGIHYNFSMPDEFWAPFQAMRGESGDLQEFRTQRYLHLIRNFHRNSWLLLFLFGASPAACRCFVQGRAHDLELFDEGTLYKPYATCLRMGNLGYRSEAQKSLFVCYNELETYVECLHRAMHTPYPVYEAIGQQLNGEYRQINTNLLQLENEFYSTIRPKPKLQPGQRPLDALASGGIEYIEVRALDLNPYLPLGIDAQQIRFLDTFLLHCLLSESPVCDQREFFEVASNIARVVERGRDPSLMLEASAQPRSLRDWAGSLLADMRHSATLLDEMYDCSGYSDSLVSQRRKLEHPELTPSGQILTDMQSGQLSFFEFSLQKSREHTQTLLEGPAESELRNELSQTSLSSLSQQREIEAQDALSFDAYLQDWNNR